MQTGYDSWGPRNPTPTLPPSRNENKNYNFMVEFGEASEESAHIIVEGVRGEVG